MTVLSDTELKAIIARRDRRYDGRFFFGVKTTRIYCRPTCPARPKPENILISSRAYLAHCLWRDYVKPNKKTKYLKGAKS